MDVQSPHRISIAEMSVSGHKSPMSRLERQGESMPRLKGAYEDMSSRHSTLSGYKKSNLNQSMEQLKPLRAEKPLKAERSLMKMTGSNIMGNALN